MHRDLKVGCGEVTSCVPSAASPHYAPLSQPENILLKSADANETGIKITDLGFAKAVTGLKALMITPCG